jgi:hypothetical protein
MTKHDEWLRQAMGLSNPKRAGYLMAQDAFKAGKHTANVIALMVQDRDFLAECELKGLDAKLAARDVIFCVWAKRVNHANA